jgi:hypothetical protein
MKKHFCLCLLLCSLVSCSYLHNGNINSFTQTQVVLSKGNFKVLRTVTGYAIAKYVLFMPIDDQSIYEIAYREMVKDARLYNYPKAIINITSDFTQHGLYPLFYTESCEVSGDVIVFTDRDTGKTPQTD